GGETERDRRRRRAEPSLERDAVEAVEALARRVCEEGEGAHRQVSLVLRQLAGTDSLDHDSPALRHVELVPELERDAGAVERRAEVGRRGGRAQPQAKTSAEV